jgi:hypothetical protein
MLKDKVGSRSSATAEGLYAVYAAQVAIYQAYLM